MSGSGGREQEDNEGKRRDESWGGEPALRSRTRTLFLSLAREACYCAENGETIPWSWEFVNYGAATR